MIKKILYFSLFFCFQSIISSHKLPKGAIITYKDAQGFPRKGKVLEILNTSSEEALKKARKLPEDEDMVYVYDEKTGFSVLLVIDKNPETTIP